jgi:hypothetical protein
MRTLHNPSHPGLTLREDVFPALGLTVTEAAEQLGVTRSALSRVLNGHAAIFRIWLCVWKDGWEPRTEGGPMSGLPSKPLTISGKPARPAHRRSSMHRSNVWRWADGIPTNRPQDPIRVLPFTDAERPYHALGPTSPRSFLIEHQPECQTDWTYTDG